MFCDRVLAEGLRDCQQCQAQAANGGGGWRRAAAGAGANVPGTELAKIQVDLPESDTADVPEPIGSPGDSILHSLR